MMISILKGNSELDPSGLFKPVMQGRRKGEVCVGGRGAHCFHMQVKVVVLNAISQSYNFFDVQLVPYASLCLENYLDQIFVKF